MFLTDDTLSGRRKDVYILIKMLKTITASSATSYKCKYALDWALGHVDPAKIELGEAIRTVLQYTTLRHKFCCVHPDLEKAGITRVEVTEQGFMFVRNNPGEF